MTEYVVSFSLGDGPFVYQRKLAMPRVETRGSENEEEIAGYRNHVL